MAVLHVNQIALTAIHFETARLSIQKVVNFSLGAITFAKVNPCTSHDVHVVALRGQVSFLSYVGKIKTPPTGFQNAGLAPVVAHSNSFNSNNVTSHSVKLLNDKYINSHGLPKVPLTKLPKQTNQKQKQSLHSMQEIDGKDIVVVKIFCIVLAFMLSPHLSVLLLNKQCFKVMIVASYNQRMFSYQQFIVCIFENVTKLLFVAALPFYKSNQSKSNSFLVGGYSLHDVEINNEKYLLQKQ
ncbi:hypothetical protein EGR_10742 [Echinococcus granulosus]|uniref:Uncharacterized protein n=1 Tax=Echinococcus granulosus TaxID=6210 RepID=W6ULJ4_ECHGR|nr:hypothetical protein EGR_10742 [Echinococcus granulosus]EUB54399.1 hypothetical protein EGR_10742 [Echinococcus granulosus]